MTASGNYMIHATDCHDDLVKGLGVCLAAIEAYHEDPSRGFPASDWHWFCFARRAYSRASLAQEMELRAD